RPDRRPARALAVACALLLSAPRAQALDPKKALSQYVHDVWTTDRGLPQNAITSLARSADGYLWLGTEEGLVRFDGLRFDLLDASVSPGLTGVASSSLVADERGLIVGSRRHGVGRLARGALRPL